MAEISQQTATQSKADNFANLMLITANVGSIFEDPKNLLKIWVKEFLQKVDEQRPDFLAVHCQEVGGKTYEESMIHVEDFIRSILDSNELKEYDKVCIFLDEDFTSTEKFTALGNIYFVHKTVKDLKIFDFEKKEYTDVNGQLIHTGNIENVTIKEKSKFPHPEVNKANPECKWSRKGFMRTRWNLQGTQFDLVNIHLFHDASNLIALKSSPSPYCKNRQDALKYTLDRFISDEFEKLPCFIFGDLNFRLNISTIVKKLTAHCEQVDSEEKGKKESILFKEGSDEKGVFLKLGQKVFDLKDSEKTFCDQDNLKWLSEHDNELEIFKDLLFELPKSFPPSYPFTEDSLDSKYMKTRCPSWCDRILFTKRAQDLIKSNNDATTILYDMIGLNVPMGDHKPILLKFKLPVKVDLSEPGTIESEAKQQANTESTDKTVEKSGKNDDQNASESDKSSESNNDKPNEQPETGSSDHQQVDDLKNLTLNEGESNSNVNTRYVCVKYGDSQISVFRETAV